MVVKALRNPSGSYYWRIADPFKYLRLMGIDAQVIEGQVTDEIVSKADVIITHGTVDREILAMLRAYQKERGKKIVVETDDFTEVTEDNPYKREHDVSQAAETMRITMKFADMITCTTKILANKLKEINPNVVVLPNYMDMDRWEKPVLQNTSDTIRIGWVGSITHLKDLEMVEKPLKRIMDEFPQVRLVIMGDLRIGEMFDGYPVENMLGVPMDVYPTKLQSLRLDIGIAPLVKNEFNSCKSNIKWQEYAISRTAGVFSPTVYQHKGFEPKYGLVADNEDSWYRAIKNLIIHPELRNEIAGNSHRLVKMKFNLRTKAHLWKEAYESLFQTAPYSLLQ